MNIARQWVVVGRLEKKIVLHVVLHLLIDLVRSEAFIFRGLLFRIQNLLETLVQGLSLGDWGAHAVRPVV